jgi:hypothetical protein
MGISSTNELLAIDTKILNVVIVIVGKVSALHQISWKNVIRIDLKNSILNIPGF